MNFVDRLQRFSWLGREFLTWLWYQVDSAAGSANLRIDGCICEVVFLDRMVLSLPNETPIQAVTLKGDQSDLRESFGALREGKTIEEARVWIRLKDKELCGTINATWFTVKGFRPAPHEQDPEDEYGPRFSDLCWERFADLESATEVLCDLFREFLALRLSTRWDTEELPKIRAWVQQG